MWISSAFQHDADINFVNNNNTRRSYGIYQRSIPDLKCNSLCLKKKISPMMVSLRISLH